MTQRFFAALFFATPSVAAMLLAMRPKVFWRRKSILRLHDGIVFEEGLMTDSPNKPRKTRLGKQLRVSHQGVVVAWDADMVFKQLRKMSKIWARERALELEVAFGPLSRGVKTLLQNAANLNAAAQHAYYLASLPNQQPQAITALYKSYNDLARGSKDQAMGAVTLAKAEAEAAGKKQTAHESLLAGLISEHPANSPPTKEEMETYDYPEQDRPKRGRPRLEDALKKAIPFTPGEDYSELLQFVKGEKN
jgi:hypothetical protein